MTFGGFQKLTLLDFPGVVACTLFTKGCNFRCPFCHNAPLVNRLEQAADFSEDEVLSYLRKRQGILEGVCITGGEPLIQPELEDFITNVKSMGYKVKLDTNGSFPHKLKELVSKGLLDYVAMDIKNSFGKYPATAGCESVSMQDIEESIDFLLSGALEYEFRTTVARELHTIEDIRLIAKRIQGATRYYIQNFSDTGNIIGSSLSSVDEAVIEAMCEEAAIYTIQCSHR